MSFFGKNNGEMSFEEELEVAVRFCTMRRFASLQEHDQSRGYYRLGLAIRDYAISLENGEDDAS
jgi:hypothetical protein